MLQVRAAAEEYHAEFAAKENTIITLTAEAEATRAHMQGEIEKLRTEMEVSAAVQTGLGDSQPLKNCNVSPCTYEPSWDMCAPKRRCVRHSGASSHGYLRAVVEELHTEMDLGTALRRESQRPAYFPHP